MPDDMILPTPHISSEYCLIPVLVPTVLTSTEPDQAAETHVLYEGNPSCLFWCFEIIEGSLQISVIQEWKY